MKNAQVTFRPNITTPNNPAPSQEESNKKTPAQTRQERQLKMIQKQKKQLDKRMMNLKKILARKITAKFIVAQNPNDDPQYLWGQVRDTVRRMGLSTMCQNNKTELVIGVTEKDNSLYKIVLRRQTEIDSDIINRLRRESDNLKNISWSNNGIVMYVWAPYVAPEGEINETPTP